jgi:hypothetical protein
VEWGCDPLNLLRSDQNQAASGSLSGGGGQSAPLGLAARKSCRPVDLEISRSQQIPIEPFNLMQPLAVAPSSQVPPALGPSASLPRFSRSFVEVVHSLAPPPAQPQGRKVCFNLRPSVITSRSSDNPAYFVAQPIRPLSGLATPPRPINKSAGSLMGFKPAEVNSSAPSQVLPCHHGPERSEDMSGGWQVVRRKRWERKERHPTPLGALLVLQAEISLK